MSARVTQETKIPDSVIRIMRHKGKIGQDIDHPPFPGGTAQFVLESYTDAGEIVFEPFCGSGTTLLGCQRTGRRHAPPRSPRVRGRHHQTLPAELSRRCRSRW